jgi:inosine/xanthosine triphosphatase
LEWSSTIVDEDDDDTLWCMAWIAIYGRRQASIIDLIAAAETKYYTGDKKPVFGIAKTATFLLPKSVTELVKKGMELSHADDQVFGRVASGQGSGTVGLLTNHLILRRDYYAHALTLALIPWIRPDVYTNGAGGNDVGGMASRLFCKSGAR